MRVLLACEESQAVTKEFRKLGHEAYSWDLIIAFPPCTHLASSGAAWFAEKRRDGRQQEGIDFFNLFTNLQAPKVAIENPIGVMSTYYRKPDQIIQPYYFGDPYRKSTCLWLKGLPKLEPTNMVDMGEQITYKSGTTMPKWYADAWKLPPAERSRVRSKTFPGIAKAMAEQWGTYE
jgi:hypothetical protein